MIEGRLGNQLIAQEQYSRIANMDFTEYRQCQKHGQQGMERSKLLFGVCDPIDFVSVQIQPPVFKGNEQNIQQNSQKFERNYAEDIQNYQITHVNDLEKIMQNSLRVRNKNSKEQYHEEKNTKIKKTDSLSDIDEKSSNQPSQGVNTVYSSKNTIKNNF